MAKTEATGAPKEGEKGGGLVGIGSLGWVKQGGFATALAWMYELVKTSIRKSDTA